MGVDDFIKFSQRGNGAVECRSSPFGGPVGLSQLSELPARRLFPRSASLNVPHSISLLLECSALFATVQVYRKLEFLILISFGEGILDVGKEMLWDSTVLQGPRLREARQHITAEKSLKGLRGVLTCPWSYSSSHEGIQFGLSCA